MNIGISITTVRRKNSFDYLKSMLSDFERIGVLDNPNYHVTVSESGSLEYGEHDSFLEEYKDKIDILFSDKRICANENVSKVIEYNCKKGFDYVMYMNDDSTVHENFNHIPFEFIQKYPDYPCWTFYCPYDFITIPLIEAGEDIYEYPYKQYYGSLCWVMKNENSLRYSKHLYNYYKSGEDVRIEIGRDFRTIAGDAQLAEFLKTNFHDTCIASHIPSLVNHIGKHSNMIPTYAQKSYFHTTDDFKLNEVIK